ncbi:TIGR03087 family PEP-CTERM/XrtA system glycosyltransferase [Agaribacter marinus]|uniref:Glycosyl transferase n=1 Tax=Agaribacter marinus TaxID=1431249 RepID=A0AA37WIF5_9ALTE|nr:TIGR03087 family PEP-CTERM/XrtA system glycosyltransferase [Agaribacter marinus]GLR70937.1 glycosyl transferase [Agaribacter marinus]
MSVLFVCQRVPYPPNKGEKLRTFHQLKFLVEQGVDITVLSPAETDDDMRDADQLAQRLNIPVHAIKVSASPLTLIAGLFKGEALSVAKFYHNKIQAFFDALIETQKYRNVVFTASSLTPYWWKKKGNLTHNIRLFCDFMDVDSNKWHQYAENASFPMRLVYRREARLIEHIEVKSCRKFERCFLIADKEVELMATFLPEDAKVPLAIGNGIDTEEFFPISTKHHVSSELTGTKSFLFVGVMDYKPNVDAVLWFVNNVWPMIIKKTPSARFKVVGMSPNAKIMALSSIQGVEVTGKVDDVTEFFQQADIFVAPFTIARGVQNKILQAMACGLPVITTTKGAEGINCSDKEDILIADDADSFMQQIDYLAIDSHTQSIANASRRRIINEYSWEGNLLPLKQAIVDEK